MLSSMSLRYFHVCDRDGSLQNPQIKLSGVYFISVGGENGGPWDLCDLK